MYDELVAGRNAVYEALCGSRGVDCVYLQRGARPKGVAKILAACKEKGVPFKEVEREKLDEMAGEVPHQGVAATVAPIAYRSIEEILEIARSRGEAPFVVLCDGILDPHNLGAILRTAECAGATRGHHPQAAQRGPHLRRGEGLCRGGGIPARGPGGKPALSAGGAEGPGPLDLRRRHGRLSLVPDRFHRAHGLVIGSEGRGVGRLVKEKADFVVSLLKGKHQLAERFGGGRHPLL